MKKKRSLIKVTLLSNLFQNNDVYYYMKNCCNLTQFLWTYWEKLKFKYKIKIPNILFNLIIKLFLDELDPQGALYSRFASMQNF